MIKKKSRAMKMESVEIKEDKRPDDYRLFKNPFLLQAADYKPETAILPNKLPENNRNNIMIKIKEDILL